MKSIFITSLFPKESISEIRLNSKGHIDNAANNFQWTLLKGLDYYYPNLKVITLPAIRSYPKHYKKPVYKGSFFQHKSNSKDKIIGFINVPIVKHLSKTINLKQHLKQSLSEIEGDVILYIYSIHSPFLKSAVDFKHQRLNVKICLIVPDLPQFMSESKNIIFKMLKYFDSRIIKKYLKSIDYFVTLTDAMKDYLDIGNRPWVRVEGIFNNDKTLLNYHKEEYKTIFYSGTLSKRYGIMSLLNAFSSIKDNDYRLWICGEGDTRKEIERRAKVDTRISYLGQLPREEVLLLQKKATVLVNPRTSEGEYTKYSFPSKTMEYLASGTPTILYNLPGIPSEYYDYCFIVEKENEESLKNMIIEVCEKDQKELDDFGLKASQFVHDNKNPIVQVGKIIEMINNNK